MGTHDYEDDSRNEDILVSVNGDIVHRQEARTIWTGYSVGPSRFPSTLACRARRYWNRWIV